MALTRRNQNNQLQGLAVGPNISRLVPVLARAAGQALKYALNNSSGTKGGGSSDLPVSVGKFKGGSSNSIPRPKRRRGVNVQRKGNNSFSVPRGVTDSASITMNGSAWLMQTLASGNGSFYRDIKLGATGASLFNNAIFGPEGDRILTYTYVRVNRITVRFKSVAPATSGGFCILAYVPNGAPTMDYSNLSRMQDRKLITVHETGVFSFETRSTFDSVIINSSTQSPDVDQATLGILGGYAETSGLASGAAMFFLDITVSVVAWM